MQFRKCSVVDLLDRVLDRGLYLDADIVIYVADVPLIAARLQAVLSSVETMVAQGLVDERLLIPSRLRSAAPSLPALAAGESS